MTFLAYLTNLDREWVQINLYVLATIIMMEYTGLDEGEIQRRME